MIEKVIKYTDYNGVTREEPFYFNISKRELMEMYYSKEGGYDKMLEKIMTLQDNAQILAEIKKLILLAYGEKSDDGRRFVKERQEGEPYGKLAAAFAETPAFDELCFDLMSNIDDAIEFVKGVLDPSILAEMEKQNPSLLAETNKKLDALKSGDAGATPLKVVENK